MAFGKALILGIGISVAFLTGCKTIPSNEVEAIKAGRASLVLFRVTTDSGVNSQRKNVPFILSLSPLDKDKRPAKIDSDDLEAPAVAENRGWKYLMLAPGSYCLTIKPYLLNAQTIASNRYYFFIPTNTPTVYAGSFNFVKIKQQQKSFEKILNLGFNLYWLKPLGVTNESGEAQLIANKSLAQFGNIAAILPVDYDNLSLAMGKGANKQILRIETDSGVPLTSNNDGADATGKIAAPAAAPLVVTGFLLFAAADQTEAKEDVDVFHQNQDTKEAAIDAGAGFAAILLAAPIVYAVDKNFGEAARKKWAPYAAAMEKK